jgi:hypothetical protein
MNSNSTSADYGKLKSAGKNFETELKAFAKGVTRLRLIHCSINARWKPGGSMRLS